MIKLLGALLKFTFFSVAILILGNWIRWDGKTVSDQVQMRVSHAENSDMAAKVKIWSKELLDDAKKAPAHLRSNVHSDTHSNTRNTIKTDSATPRLSPHEIATEALKSHPISEEIPPTERQKLRALIRELNSPVLSAKNTEARTN